MSVFVHLTLILATQGVASVYFTQDSYYATLTADLQREDPIIKLFAFEEDRLQSGHSLCAVHQTGPKGDWPNERKNDPSVQIFSFNSSSGWIFAAKRIDDTVLSGEQRRLFQLTVSCISKGDSREGDKKASTRVFVSLVKSTNHQTAPCDTRDFRNLCFGGIGKGKLQVQENLFHVPIARLRGTDMSKSCHKIPTYYVVKESDSSTGHISVHNMTSQVWVDKPYDSEKMSSRNTKILTNTINIEVKCLVEPEKLPNMELKASVDLTIKDMNDNGPVHFKPAQKKIVIEIQEDDDTKEGQKVKQFTVTDADVKKLKDGYNIYIGNDSEGLFRIGGSTVYPPYIFAEVEYAKDLPPYGDTYSFSVVFNDTKMRPIDNQTQAAIFDVHVTRPLSKRDQHANETSSPQGMPRSALQTMDDKIPTVLNISKAASKFTQVMNFSRLKRFKKGRFKFSMPTVDTGDDFQSIFGITPISGIIYIQNSAFLHKVNKTSDRLLKVVVEDTKSARQAASEIRLNIREDNIDMQPCDGGCSSHKDKVSCETSCGLGAPRGRCKWRQGVTKMTVNYTTCTHSTATCPDGKCDDLERTHLWLCPQDCAKSLLGQGAKSSKPGARGIYMGKGVCWCRDPNVCECHMGTMKKNTAYAYGKTPPVTEATSTIWSTSKVSVGHRIAISEPEHAVGGCDRTCWTSLLFALGCCLVALLLGGICIRKYHKNRKLKLKTMKHMMGSVLSVPSDYIGGSDSRLSNGLSVNSLNWSPRRAAPRLKIDKKWEFPRKNLLLDKTLGEGEFGRVLCAEARNLNGVEGYTTVAVKMLKHCATASELRDLLSEYHLLKEVSHRNVIKLLGACTQKEPFYLIVEYCEHGSLRSYLRAFRQNNGHYLSENNERQQNTTTQDDNMVTFKDLLSFSWQIANGMAYLSGMKLVHRDLAARNVLVATGKVIKISDFGLTRDVYEGDTYMKKSKGRIPVKWMAPECLYDHVYTTKSDVADLFLPSRILVRPADEENPTRQELGLSNQRDPPLRWSYGVVLWEIFTLGANPYPGIAPERLYQSLKAGYRMKQPPGCSNELFQIMEACWKYSPAERPHFRDLSTIFENLLMRDVEYLDLGAAIEENPILDDADLEANEENQGSETKKATTTDDSEYGSISILPMNDNAYLTPRMHVRNIADVINDEWSHGIHALDIPCEKTQLLSYDNILNEAMLKKKLEKEDYETHDEETEQNQVLEFLPSSVV